MRASHRLLHFSLSCVPPPNRSYLQMLMVLGVFKARGTAIFNDIVQRPAQIAGGGLSASLPVKCLLGSQFYGTYALNMFTPFIAAAATCVLIGPIWAIKAIQAERAAGRPNKQVPHNISNPFCCRPSRPAHSWERKLYELQNKRSADVFEPTSRFIAVLVFVLFAVCTSLRCSSLCSHPILSIETHIFSLL